MSERESRQHDAATKAIEAGLEGAPPGSSLLHPCTAPRELTSAQPWLRHGSGPLTPAHLKAAAAHLRG